MVSKKPWFYFGIQRPYLSNKCVEGGVNDDIGGILFVVLANFFLKHLVLAIPGVLQSSAKIVEDGLDLVLHRGGGFNFIWHCEGDVRVL